MFATTTRSWFLGLDTSENSPYQYCNLNEPRSVCTQCVGVYACMCLCSCSDVCVFCFCYSDKHRAYFRKNALLLFLIVCLSFYFFGLHTVLVFVCSFVYACMNAHVVSRLKISYVSFFLSSSAMCVLASNTRRNSPMSLLHHAHLTIKTCP